MTPSVGIFVAPPGLESIEGVQEALAAPGVEGLWWPDHWMGWGPAAAWQEAGPIAERLPSPDLYADPFVEMAVLGREVGATLVGTCMTDCVRRHPVGLLQSIESVLRALPEARFVLGIGAGERENLQPYGLPDPRVGRLDEVLTILGDLLEAGVATFDGEHFTLDRAPCPAPLSRERLSIWVGAHGPRMLELAARRGDGWMPMGFPAPAMAKKLPTLKQTRTEAGMRSPLTAAVCIVVAVVDTDADADTVAASPAMKRLALFSGGGVFRSVGATHPFGDRFNPMQEYVPGWLDADEVRAAVAQVPDEVVRRVVTITDPAGLAGMLADYGSAGVEHVVVWDVLHLVDPDSRKASLQKLPAIAAQAAEATVGTGR